MAFLNNKYMGWYNWGWKFQPNPLVATVFFFHLSTWIFGQLELKHYGEYECIWCIWMPYEYIYIYKWCIWDVTDVYLWCIWCPHITDVYNDV